MTDALGDLMYSKTAYSTHVFQYVTYYIMYYNMFVSLLFVCTYIHNIRMYMIAPQYNINVYLHSHIVSTTSHSHAVVLIHCIHVNDVLLHTTLYVLYLGTCMYCTHVYIATRVHTHYTMYHTTSCGACWCNGECVSA